MHKILGVILGVCFSLNALAVDGSAERHQLLLKQAAMSQCQVTRAYSEWVLLDTQAHSIDQGITDYLFVSEVRLVDVVNQNEYKVRITSQYHSMYDHEAQDWGRYLVQDLGPCTQLN